MNLLNQRGFWYAQYIDTVEVFDDYGNQVATTATYSNPIYARGNISPAKGSVVARQFGDDDLYDRVIAVDNSYTPIDEYSVLWIDVEPVIKDDGSTDTPWDYIVRKVARGLKVPGSANIAISKVSVS